MRRGLVASVLVLASVAGCGGGSGVAGIVSPLPVRLASHHGIHRIKHVVVIMQENRSFDSYFGTFPGADGLPTDDGGSRLRARPARRRAATTRTTTRTRSTAGGPHGDAARADIDGGQHGRLRADRGEHGGAAAAATAASCAIARSPDVMGYHDAREIPNYWRWANDFTLQDHMFEPIASWSLPAHLFMVSGWSARARARAYDDARRQAAQNRTPGRRPATNAPTRRRHSSATRRQPRRSPPADWPAAPAPPVGTTTRTDLTYCSAQAPRELALLRPQERRRARAREHPQHDGRDLGSAAVVHRRPPDGQTGNVTDVSHFWPPRVAGTSPTSPGSYPTRPTRSTRPPRRRPGRRYVPG